MGAFAAKCRRTAWNDCSESGILRASFHRVRGDPPCPMQSRPSTNPAAAIGAPKRAPGARIESRHPDMAITAKRSLFSILVRSPWWLSVLIAAALFMAVRQFMPDYAALASTLPFLAIAGYAGCRQMRAPSAERGADALARLRALSWRAFAALIEEAFRRDGHTVVALADGVADYELRKNGRVTLLGCKRWKVAQ